MTVREPEWLEDDLAWALAWKHEQDCKCPGCKLPLDETTDPANNGLYEVPLPVRCFACTPLAKAHADYAESDPGLLLHAERVDDDPPVI
ncbi:hypothetical protein DQ384_05460 [Sphaerisporangium album]|uniref:Uncharacterized protein n=1 Tax=Sphaerisporangium album TaxID=509200 RepID=A0A367FQM4_9ACTN|nr:hypothetical protein [Sphaerisporangium album]RCG31990.1 hypothetical protein DQ384_05460 [Sphaerisporangium album]